MIIKTILTKLLIQNFISLQSKQYRKILIRYHIPSGNSDIFIQ